MFGLSAQELAILGICCFGSFAVVAVIVLVVVLTSRSSQQK